MRQLRMTHNPIHRIMMATSMIAIGAIIAVTMMFTLNRLSGQLTIRATELQPEHLLKAFAAYIGYFILNACGWLLVLRTFSVNLPWHAGISIWITSEACRWLPGSIWNYGARTLRLARCGVLPTVAAASMGLELMLTLAGWFSVATVSLVWHRAELRSILVSIPFTSIGRWVAALTSIALVSILASRRFPIVHRKLTDRWQTVVTARPTRMSVCLITYYVPLCCLSGWALYEIILAICPTSSIPFTAILGANAISWLVGFFAVFAPSGMIVREGALTTILAVWLPLESAIAIAVVWRGLQIVEELFLVASFSIPRRTKSLVTPLPFPCTTGRSAVT